jgi:hypothetical protein
MRNYLFLPSLLLCVVLSYLPTHGTVEAEDSRSPVLPGQAQMISITDAGIEPLHLTLKKEDGLALFLNDSKDSLITLDLAYEKHATHCASANLTIGDDGVIRSKEPIPPKDFASTCFHDPGSYAFTIYGLKGSPAGVKGSITVE